MAKTLCNLKLFFIEVTLRLNLFFVHLFLHSKPILRSSLSQIFLYGPQKRFCNIIIFTTSKIFCDLFSFANLWYISCDFLACLPIFHNRGLFPICLTAINCVFVELKFSSLIAKFAISPIYFYYNCMFTNLYF